MGHDGEIRRVEKISDLIALSEEERVGEVS